MLVLLLVLLLAGGAAAQTTSPVDVALLSLNVSAMSVWQVCGGALFSDTTLRLDDILAQCPGRVLFACYTPVNETYLTADVLRGVVATNHSTFQFSGSFLDSLTGLPVYVNNTANLIYGGNSTVVPSCEADYGGTCFQMIGGVFGPLGYCPGVGAVNGSDVVGRVFYSDPCSGLSPGASCAGVYGLCGSSGVCDSTYKCVNSTLYEVNNSSCTTYTCHPATGAFTSQKRANGTLCPNANFCTATSECQDGDCVEATAYSCPDPYTCAPAYCNYTSQACESTAANTSTLCDAGGGCYPSRYCDGAGSCEPPAYYPPPTINGGCMYGVSCNNATGQWTYAPVGTGTPCNNSDPCSAYSTCQSGFTPDLVCTTTIYNPCIPPSDCQYSPFGCTNGICNFTNKAAGTFCDPNDPCIVDAFCTSGGVCQGSPALQCTGFVSPCIRYEMQATSPTTCECVPTVIADGGACEFGSGLCANPGTCTAGVCSATTPKACPGDDCNAATTCNSITGCSNPTNEGGPCNTDCRIDGVCYIGTCTLGMLNTSNVVCTGSPARTLGSIWDYIF